MSRFLKSFLFLLYIFAVLPSIATEITIWGQGHAEPWGNNPVTTVDVYDKSDMTLLGTTTTNTHGYYTVTLQFVGTGDLLTKQEEGARLIQNPSGNGVNVELSSRTEQHWQILVYDDGGRLLGSQSILLASGTNTITISNLGIAGMKTIVLKGITDQYALKAILSQSTALSPRIAISSTAKQLKSTAVGDSLYIVFTAPEHYSGMDTSVVMESQMVNYILQQVPDTVSFVLRPFLETGEPVTLVNPDFTVTIEWEDSTFVYPVTDGQIEVYRLLYPEVPTVLGSVWINNDTTTHIVNDIANGVLNWCIGRHPKQITNRPNIYQSESSNHLEFVDYKVLVPIDSLNNKTVYHYTVRKRAETQTNVYEPMNSLYSRTLIESSGNIKSSMFVDLAPFGVADSLDIVQKTYNEDTGEQMTPEQINNALNLFMSAIQTRYLPNGDTLLPPHRIYSITSDDDPRWQEVIARGGANSIKSTYYNGTPAVGRNWALTYTYNGALRINYSYAKYNFANTNGNIFAEQFSAVTGEEEGGMGHFLLYIWNATANLPSTYAYSISTLPALLNLGTGQ